jgi:hypothetical protein
LLREKIDFNERKAGVFRQMPSQEGVWEREKKYRREVQILNTQKVAITMPSDLLAVTDDSAGKGGIQKQVYFVVKAKKIRSYP